MGELKPILTALILPPTSLLLWVLLGWHWRRQRVGSVMLLSGVLALWLLSCHGSAVWLARHALPQYLSLSAADLRAQGLGNCLAHSGAPLGKTALARALAAFEARKDEEGKVAERLRQDGARGLV